MEALKFPFFPGIHGHNGDFFFLRAQLGSFEFALDFHWVSEKI